MDFLDFMPLSSLRGVPDAEHAEWTAGMDRAWMLTFIGCSACLVTGFASPDGIAFATMHVGQFLLAPLGVAALIRHGYSAHTADESPDQASDASNAGRLKTTVTCRNTLCPYYAHPDTLFEGHCCHLCAYGKGHGPHCQHRQRMLAPLPLITGPNAGHTVVWLHGHAGAVNDRAWLLPSLDVSHCKLLEFPAGLASRTPEGARSWFQYSGQWAATGAGTQAEAALDHIIPKTLEHVGQQRSVTIIGYSQGAAIAVLAAAALRAQGIKVFVLALRGQFEPTLANESARELNWDIRVYCLQSRRDKTAPMWSSKGSWRELRSRGATIDVMATRGQSHTSMSRQEVKFIQSHLYARDV